MKHIVLTGGGTAGHVTPNQGKMKSSDMKSAIHILEEEQ